MDHQSDPAATVLLDLLQLSDSTFPSGSYAHSLGLEWLDGQEGFDIEAVVRARLSQSLARLELPVARTAYAATRPDELAEVDGLLDVLTPVREIRQASRSVGRSFLRAALKLRPGGLPAAAAERGVEHQPVAYGMVMRAWGVPIEQALASYSLQAVRQQLSAAQRLGRLGQSRLQELLNHMKPAVCAAIERSRGVPLHEAGAFSPWMDMAGMRHERQFARLFLS